MFKAVIFDCDGVLVDSEVVGLDASAAYLQARGMNWSKAELIERFSGLRDDEFFKLLASAYEDANGAPPDDSFFTGLYDQRRLSDMPMEAVTGAHEALAKIDLPRAVASSSRTDRLERKLKTTRLWDFFAPHIYSADCVDNGKPEPDIYLYAASKLGVLPAECLVVEDSTHGVYAGINAGMTVWGFTGGGHCFAGHAERLIAAGAAWVAADFASLSERLAVMPVH
ncbi:MAG: HAD family hydrolase [Pseudomonadota bacterium]